jgi:hypothetical protein
VCELAVEISEAQRHEIAEIEWLIDDIDRSGVATSPQQAGARPVPAFGDPTVRSCRKGWAQLFAR